VEKEEQNEDEERGACLGSRDAIKVVDVGRRDWRPIGLTWRPPTGASEAKPAAPAPAGGDAGGARRVLVMGCWLGRRVVVRWTRRRAAIMEGARILLEIILLAFACETRRTGRRFSSC